MNTCPSDAGNFEAAVVTIASDDDAMGLPEHLRALFNSTKQEGDIDPSNLEQLKSLL